MEKAIKPESIDSKKNQQYSTDLNNSIKEAESGNDLISFTIEELIIYTPPANKLNG